MATRTLDCDKEQSVGDFGSNRGNGNDNHAPIGLWSGVVYRDFMRFDLDWTGVYQITKAVLRLTTAQENHVGYGGSPRIQIQRCSASFNENGGSEGGWSASASTVYPGPGVTGTTYDSGSSLSNSHDKVRDIDITALLEAWAPASVLKSSGSAGGASTNYGLRIQSFDEASTSRTIEFYSRRAGSSHRPQIILTYDDNRPPNVPTITSITGTVSGTSDPTIVGSTSGDTIEVVFSASDPDGDAIGKATVESYIDGETSASPASGNRLGTSGDVVPVSLGSGSYSVKVTGLPKRTIQRIRVRVQDVKGRWGSYTLLADTGARTQTAYSIGAPVNSLMQTDPTAPHIFGSINSSDPADYVSSWEGEFYRDDASLGAVTLWAPGPTAIGGAPTRSDITWGGTTLNPGDTVRWRQRHYNRDGVPGTWTSFVNTVMLAQTGPTTMTPADVSTKMTSRTPTLTIANATNFDAYRWRLYRSGALIYDSGQVAVGSTGSVSPVIPSGYANWGDTLTWDAAVRPTGNTVLDPYSPQRGMQFDTLPTTILSASA